VTGIECVEFVWAWLCRSNGYFSVDCPVLLYAVSFQFGLSLLILEQFESHAATWLMFNNVRSNEFHSVAEKRILSKFF
jgi:hypothetical protein